MLKQVLLARFEPVVARFGPRKNPKCLENGPFWDQKWLKNGSKKHLFSSDRGPFGMPKRVFLARFEPVVARFGPRKIPKCLENGPFWDQKWLKNGSKKPLFKSDRGPFGMPKQVFLARFEPVVARFGPRKIPKCLENVNELQLAHELPTPGTTNQGTEPHSYRHTIQFPRAVHPKPTKESKATYIVLTLKKESGKLVSF